MTCLICGSSDLQIRHFCTEETTISRKPLLAIIDNVLRLPQIELNAEICQLCFELVDEVDAFEHSLLRAKEKLENRYSSSDQKSDGIKNETKNFDTNIDADYFANEDTEKHDEELINEDNAEDIGNTDAKFTKKRGYISRLVLRGQSKKALDDVEHFKANLDMALYPPQEPTKIITSFEEVNECLRNSAIQTIELLRLMPREIKTTKDQLKWDLIMLKCQVTNLHFGIPGESHCHECNLVFNNIHTERYHHYFTNHSLNNFKCQKCQKIFSDPKLLARHLAKEHEDISNAARNTLDIPEPNHENYSCDFCFSAFDSEFAYYYHFLEYHKPMPSVLQCLVCGLKAANPMDFKRHILISHGGFSHLCLICNKRYSSRGSILTHLRDHNRARTKPKNRPHKKEPTTCPECGMVSKSKLLHDRHLLSTHGIQVPQVCHLCQETLPDPKAMVEHKRARHSNEICYICAKSFLNLSDLNLHISRMHPEAITTTGLGQENAKIKPIKISAPKEEKTMCEVCSKMVSTRNIQGHMKNHQEKELSCPKCPRMFRWKSSLTSHLTSAHGDSVKVVLVSCEFCGKQFNNKSNLRQHRYSHTGGPYSCKCGRGFARKDMLNSHVAKCINTTIISAP